MPNDRLPQLEDIELMTRVRDSDDREAFSCLVERYQNILLNFFSRIGVAYDVEDLVQQTFLKVYQYRRNYQPLAKFRTYLFLIARQVWIDELRQRKRRQRASEWLKGEPPEELFAIPPDPPSAAGARLDVAKALAQLSPRMREVIELAVYQELPYLEIAEILGIPIGTVKSRIFNALAKMKKILTKEKKRWKK